MKFRKNDLGMTKKPLLCCIAAR